MKQITNKNGLINTVNEIINHGREAEILQLYTEDEEYNGRVITVKDRKLINFGSCSYLGLEIDERLKKAAIEAVNKYGIQFSSSRSYVSCSLYTELEQLMGELFRNPVVLTPTTTLGHQAVISVVVEEGDAIILDQQVHASVQYAANHMQLKGVPVSVVRHNNMDELEMFIKDNYNKFDRIWYMADGIYSMYGDYMPVERLSELLDKYEKFHLYVDDAHGMSWYGDRGQGFVLGKVKLHSRMIVGSSFAKGFGTGGGVFVFPDKETRQKVRNCGGPLMFSGPVQIPVLAASIASAKIHLSGEILNMQQELNQKVEYCYKLLRKNNLPVISNPETPIKFIGLGLARVGYNMVKRMINDGLYCNLSIFPAVPETCTGLRFTITRHHTFNDIKRFVDRLAYHFPKALAEEGRTMEDIYRAFRKVAKFDKIENVPVSMKGIDKYKMQYETTIRNIPKEVWNKYVGANGSFDWDWLNFLEQTFNGNILEEHNWSFHYYIIYNTENKPVLATFFTLALSKDDMLSQPGVSFQLEEKRKSDPYYLCSRTFMMGSLLTEGQHIYIDRVREDWKDVLMLLLDRVWKDQVRLNANVLSLRDFNAEDEQLKTFLMDQGFIKVGLPDNHIIEDIKWETSDDYLQSFNSRRRWYLKDSVLKYKSLFDVEIVSDVTDEDINKWYKLYKNVKSRSYELNTFELPRKFFADMAGQNNCEIMQIKLKAGVGNNANNTVAVTFNYKSARNNFCGIIIGLDYDYVTTFGLYKQALFHSVIRAGQVKANKLFLGFTASDVKRKFGAKVIPQVAYIQMQDSYNLSVMNAIANTAKVENTNAANSTEKVSLLKTEEEVLV